MPPAHGRSRNPRRGPRLVQPLVQPGRQGRERVPGREPALSEDSRHRPGGGRRDLLGELRLPSDCESLSGTGGSRAQRGPSASPARALGAPRRARALPAGLQSIRPRRLPTFPLGANLLPARRAGRIHGAGLADGSLASLPGCDPSAGASEGPGAVRCAARARAARLSRPKPHLPAWCRGYGPRPLAEGRAGRARSASSDRSAAASHRRSGRDSRTPRRSRPPA